MKKNLTDKFLQNLKPTKVGRLEIFDTLVPGFGVRIGTSGRPSFFVMYRVGLGTALQDAGLFYYGMRVVEPHHDGTPHWHMLLFCAPADLVRIKTLIRKYMAEGNPRPRKGVKFKDMDPAEGGATAYMAKYISKNIDGEGLDPEERPVVARVIIWKELWGFDQFEQLGGPPVGIWRDLRRIQDQSWSLDRCFERLRRPTMVTGANSSRPWVVRSRAGTTRSSSSGE